LPSAIRQGQRLGASFASIKESFLDTKIQVVDGVAHDSQTQVLVIETVGDVSDFERAVRAVPGLQWMLETEDEGEADEDFYQADASDKPLSQRLYLVATDEQALEKILQLWTVYVTNPSASFPSGLAPLKQAFARLREIRYWNERDRIESDIRKYWEFEIEHGVVDIRFEIELWYVKNDANSQAAEQACRKLVTQLGGQVISAARLKEIRYHSLLVSLPAKAIQQVLDGQLPLLMKSPTVMFFKPVATGMSFVSDDEGSSEIIERPASNKPPLIALLDGVPVENHQLLTGRLIVDDPDGLAARYAGSQRKHGTSMASLLLHGSLTQNETTLDSRLYVRPILCPDNSGHECTPNEQLVVDVVHRAIRRIFDGDGGEAPAAASVIIINLSVGDPLREFDRRMSGWARLLDWLSWKYKVLIFVSAGNFNSSLPMGVTIGALPAMTTAQVQEAAVSWLFKSAGSRPILNPAEAINAVTVGAHYSDGEQWTPVNGRRLIFIDALPATYSRTGLGYRRSIKPEVLLPGGRALYNDPNGSANEPANLAPLAHLHGAPPGLKCAAPGTQGVVSAICWTKGTSAATALAARHSAQIAEALAAYQGTLPGLSNRGQKISLVKALLIHGAAWEPTKSILDKALQSHSAAQKKAMLAGQMGFGSVDTSRGTHSLATRATLIACSEIGINQTHRYDVPLPPSLSSKKEWRRLTITLAWLTPTNASSLKYRMVKVSFRPPISELLVKRTDVDFNAVKRGTVQHEVLTGEQAAVFEDGDGLVIEVVCQQDSGTDAITVPYGLCVSLEVADGVQIPIYEEIRARIPVAVQVKA